MSGKTNKKISLKDRDVSGQAARGVKGGVVRKAGERPLEYLTITMTDATISG